MDKKEKGRLAQLERRAAWLKTRSDNYKGKDNSYDKAELSALTWAIDIIKQHFAERMARENGDVGEL